ncbi:MAG: hypothetical protein K2J71_07665 [Oscillospiraceae bacterium]|nr:hypothetical protein [Oscillospiraceae bacterium]
MRTKKLHPELKLLLQNLTGDAEIPDEKPQASEASRQKVDQIVKKLNQEQREPVPESKPVYSKPPKRKKVLTAPVPVEHFSEEPSQNPAVRMHDRLLQDAMPKPDPERRPRNLKNTVNPDLHKNKKSGKKPRKSPENPEKMPEKKDKKKFHIQIGELPPDIPRDTSIADRIREERLAQALASVPPKTPEQLRKEQVRKRAMKIREQMRLQEELARQQATQSMEIPEEEIPAWEDKLAELSEKNSEDSADQLRIFNDSVTEILMTPKIQKEEQPDLRFDQTVILQTVSMQNVINMSEMQKTPKTQTSGKVLKLKSKIRKSGTVQSKARKKSQKNHKKG